VKKTRRTGPRPSGRSRDAVITSTVLDATLSLGESIGFERVTMEKVAEVTGVAKTTLYRRWPNAWAILMDAFLAETREMAPLAQKGTVRESFSEDMKLLVEAYSSGRGQMLLRILARAHVDTALMDAVKKRWLEPLQVRGRSIVAWGIASGELQEGPDPDLVLDILYGPVYHRLFFGAEAVTASYIDKLISTVFSGLERRNGAQPRATQSRRSRAPK